MAFSPDGERLATFAADQDYRGANFRVWDVATGAQRPTFVRDDRICGPACLAPDGRSVVIGTANEPRKFQGNLVIAVAERWQESTLKLPSTPDAGQAGLSRMALSPDGRTLATGDALGRAQLWELGTGRELARLAADENMYLSTLAFSPGGSTLVVANGSGAVKLWDVAGGKVLAKFRAHQFAINWVCFTHDGRAFATASGDGTVKLWDRATVSEQAMLQGHSGPVRSIAFSPDGMTLASGGDDGIVKIWDIRTAQELISLEAHDRGVSAVAFSPDGQTLASGGAAADGKGEIVLWSAADRC